MPVPPYVSPSEQAIREKNAAEELRLNQLLAADNFRELALIDMMDGLLEVRWEDELKKDVPKPKCMVGALSYMHQDVLLLFTGEINTISSYIIY